MGSTSPAIPLPGVAQAQLELKVTLPAVKLAQVEPAMTDQKVRTALPQLEKLAEQTLKKTGVPGMTIAVVYKDQVVYLKGLGVCEAGKKEPI